MGNLLNHKNHFSRVLIDEAAQAVEPTSLVPLMAGAKAFVCIGDDKQLPATVHSRAAREGDFSTSLFERLLKDEVVQEHAGFVQLNVQRRMHSSLAAFPSKCFYKGLVENGCLDEARPPIAGFKWPQNASIRVCFVDMEASYGASGEESVGKSKR